MLRAGIMRRLAACVVACILIVSSAAASVAAQGELELQSRGAILIDATTGKELYAKNADDPMPPASLTKIMTLYLAFKAIEEGQVSLSDTVVTSPEAASLGGSQIWLEPGEEMSLRDMLLAVAVGSANDASVAVGEHIAGTRAKFVELMNETARELGMTNTSFRNEHGQDEEGHLMSPRDVAVISRYAVKYPGLLEMTSTWEEYLRGGDLWLVNTNRLLKHFPGVDGLKTGWTNQAGYCLAASAKRGDTRLIAVVMGAPNSTVRFAEVSKLLTYGFANFVTVPVAPGGEPLGEVTVHKGRVDEVAVVLLEDLAVTVEKGAAEDIRHRIELASAVEAPVEKGQPLGTIVVEREGEVIEEATLVAAAGVERLGLWGLFMKTLRAVLTFYR